MVTRPSLVIADECTTALDVTTQTKVVELFRTLVGELGIGLLFVTHDLMLASDLCDRIAVMKSGRVVEQGAGDDVLDRPQHDYTRRLLAAIPALDLRGGTTLPCPSRTASARTRRTCPRTRWPATASRAPSRAPAPPSRSVAAYDEDAVTMAVEALREITAGASAGDRLVLATTSAPYDGKTSAGIVHAALGLDPAVVAADLHGNRSGATAPRPDGAGRRRCGGQRRPHDPAARAR